MTVAHPLPPRDPKLESRKRAIGALVGANSRFLVGGGYAFSCYTGIQRVTKDLDLFVRREDLHDVLGVLDDAGFRTEVTFPHWLGKAYDGAEYIDIIFSSGNGIARVDDGWFQTAPAAEVLGHDVLLVPPEEMIWSKAFVMERDRYDGADICHTIRYCHDCIDWDHLVQRFGPDWRVLLSHLVLFGFVYPDAHDVIPHHVLDGLMERLREDHVSTESVCRGTLLSRWQYLPDLEDQYQDALRLPRSGLSAEDVAKWTAPEAPKKA